MRTVRLGLAAFNDELQLLPVAWRTLGRTNERFVGPLNISQGDGSLRSCPAKLKRQTLIF